MAQKCTLINSEINFIFRASQFSGQSDYFEQRLEMSDVGSLLIITGSHGSFCRNSLEKVDINVS